jgi:hypothetical protein
MKSFFWPSLVVSHPTSCFLVLRPPCLGAAKKAIGDLTPIQPIVAHSSLAGMKLATNQTTLHAMGVADGGGDLFPGPSHHRRC